MSPKRGHNIPIRSHPISVLHPPFPFLRLILVPSHFIPFIFVYLLSPSSHALNSTRAIGSGRALSGAEPRPAASNFDIFGVQERYLHGGKDLVFVPLILFKTLLFEQYFYSCKKGRAPGTPPYDEYCTARNYLPPTNWASSVKVKTMLIET